MSSTFATHEFDAAALARTMHDLHDHGVAVVPGVLSREEAATGLERLWAAAAANCAAPYSVLNRSYLAP